MHTESPALISDRAPGFLSRLARAGGHVLISLILISALGGLATGMERPRGVGSGAGSAGA